jgi:hypothetical protein
MDRYPLTGTEYQNSDGEVTLEWDTEGEMLNAETEMAETESKHHLAVEKTGMEEKTEETANNPNTTQTLEYTKNKYNAKIRNEESLLRSHQQPTKAEG